MISSARLLHVSDLHFGTREDPLVERALSALVENARPELIVATGDLAHRGRRSQHEAAARLLRGFGVPVLAVHGNHDLPYTFPARFTRPWAEFERLWGTTQPVYRSDRFLVVGLNSARPWRQQSGAVSERQLAWAAEQLATAETGVLRVVALHHHLLGAPWRSRKKPVADRNRVLGSLVESGAELIVAGHIHQGAIAERREFEVALPGGERAVTVAIAPGLGQPRPRRRGEARGLYVHEARPRELLVRTYVWRIDGWSLTAERRFPRGVEPLELGPGGS